MDERQVERPRLILLNKPMNVLCQFRGDGGRATLAEHISIAGVYPAGRLDYDSEGLLLLTNHGPLQHRICSPQTHIWKTYLVQVEGLVTELALQQLSQGLVLRDGPTRPARARAIAEPELWPRNPPIRSRKHIPTSWIELSICEGRNRQVRRMAAATGFPVLRLVRIRVGEWKLGALRPGMWLEVPIDAALLSRSQTHRKTATRSAKAEFPGPRRAGSRKPRALKSGPGKPGASPTHADGSPVRGKDGSLAERTHIVKGRRK